MTKKRLKGQRRWFKVVKRSLLNCVNDFKMESKEREREREGAGVKRDDETAGQGRARVFRENYLIRFYFVVPF